MIDRNTSDHQIFELDLAAHESQRRTEILAALGESWNPVAVLEGEDEAYRLLYSGLDAEQQATYDMLVAAEVLPGPGRA